MVGFWDVQRKIARAEVIERIKLAEKHGIGKMAMEEKARLLKLDRIIQDAKK